jgi:predicted ATPase/DNA-binding CsgD family transcriptional regulator
MGKTRLALAIAHDVAPQFAGGVIWVDLTSLTDATLVPSAVATAFGVRPRPDTSITTALTAHLRVHQLLLLLDNCEHVIIETAALVAELLATCPAVQVLATSRMALHLSGEQVLPVPPLALPDHDVVVRAETVRDAGSVQLFVARVHAQDPAFALSDENAEVVAEICRRLDGLPLAIELAAARVPVLPPHALLIHLEQRLSLLTEGARDLPARQQTMRNTIAWSYDLLAPSEQRLFRCLAVFVGGFTLDAAMFVAEHEADGLDRLSRLVTSSLVQQAPGVSGQPRYQMFETVREFGLEQLATHDEEAATAHARHAHYFLDRVDAEDAAVAPHLIDGMQVLHALDREHPNLRAALGWFVVHDVAAFVHLAGVLHTFWLHFGYLHEGRSWLKQAVAVGPHATASDQVWASVGFFSMLPNQHDDAARTLIDAAVALARQTGDPLALALATEYRGYLAMLDGQFQTAEAVLRESRVAFSTLPADAWVIRNITHIDAILGMVALLRGDIDVAQSRAAVVLGEQRDLEQTHGAAYPYVGYTQTILGHVARARGEHALALAWYQGAVRDTAPSWQVHTLVWGLGGIAGTLAALGQWKDAARIFGATEALCERTGIPFQVHVFDWQRALGLPEPWSQADAPFGFGAAATLHAQVHAAGLPPPAPLPHPAASTDQWASGRLAPIVTVVAEALSLDLARRPADNRRDATVPVPRDPFKLSPREREVLALLSQRLTHGEIAETLSISPKTVSRHVANLFTKLDVSSRREAVALAARHDLV